MKFFLHLFGLLVQEKSCIVQIREGINLSQNRHLNGVFWSRILKKSILVFAYFQSLHLQEYKIDQPEVFVTYFVEILPCLVFS